MSHRNPEPLETIKRMTAGTVRVFENVPWELYEHILEGLDDRPGLRVSYDEGRLEVMSPLPEHERHKEFLVGIARILAEEFGIAVETLGSTTWKRRKILKGVEPDTCFYVANAARVIGKQHIDLESDPPPDIVVEIDHKSNSRGKFPIYAALRVPEIWLYDGKSVSMYESRGSTYSSTLRSRFFEGLSASTLTEALEMAMSQGQTAALKEFRKQIRKRRSR